MTAIVRGQADIRTVGIASSTRTPMARVPTIHDLRVKQCYICMEQDDGPRAWTHPCNCTLVAHSDCLLKWIHSSQDAPNALKCPQCGTNYQLVSHEPFLFKAMSLGNRIVQKCGTYFTVITLATAVGIAGTS